MVHGREVRFPAIRGLACLAQVLSVLQKVLPQRAAHGSGASVDLPLYYQAFHPKPVASMGSIGDDPMKPLEGKNVLVTGGTGSLGRVLVRRLLAGEMGQPKQVLVFSRDETKQHYMRLQYAHRPVATEEIIYKGAQGRLAFRVGDVREYASVVAAVRRADVVFNAAAMKQVPTCEYFPGEAVETNVLGPANIVRAIRENGAPVELVVGVSTDKACKPVNVMGMTKALQERIFINANLGQSQTRFICVRYGNVISSRGSVVPLFLDQIRKGGPITITMREMTRFLLTLDGAVDTIFAAVRGGQPGEIVVPKLPAARVTDIADVLVDGRDIGIEYIGIRPGEKIHEVLVSEEEVFRSYERGGYYVIRPMLPELDGERGERALDREYSSAEVTLTGQTLRALLDPFVAGAPRGKVC